MRRALAFFRRTLALVGVGAVVASGCYKSGAGPDPNDAPYYPVGIALSPSGKFLFLANSNFDLQFNSGTLLAYDVKAIEADAIACKNALIAWRDKNDKAVTAGQEVTAPPKCRNGDTDGNGNAVKAPLADGSEPPQPDYTKAGVRVGAFAADVKVVPRADSPTSNGARLLLPVRGDASLTVVDFDESDGIHLTCGASRGENHFDQDGHLIVDNTCASDWRLTGGDGPGGGSRGLVLEGEPFAIATADDLPKNDTMPEIKGLAAMVHQSSGDVSLFINTESASLGATKLAYTLTGLPGGATSIARFDDGITDAIRFLVTNRTQNTLSIVQLFRDPKDDRSGLVFTGTVQLTPQSQGYDSRGIVVDPPNAGETRPTRVFVTNRTPASIVVGQVDQYGTLSFFDNIALPVGPSRIVRTVVNGHTVLLAASYDARSIVVVDPDARRVTNVVLTHRGPYAIAVDQTNQFAFVANFTDSTIQVIDISPTAKESLIYSVGKPSGPPS